MTTITTHDTCAHCSAPLDDRQRYCVVCGASRRHPGDPVMRYLAARNARPAVVAPARRPRSDGRLTALALALLPLAAAAGVLVGRDHAPAGDARLLAALAARPAAAAAPAATVAPVAKVSSDFTLSKGFVVRLSTVTTAAAVAGAKSAATGKGAHDVGVINPADFVLTPSSGSAYVIYSGQFRTRAAAQKARKQLLRRFPAATVVAVGDTGGGARSSAAVAAEDAVVRKHPTAQQKADGAKIVQQIQATRGKTYVEQQRKLPDTIVVP